MKIMVSFKIKVEKFGFYEVGNRELQQILSYDEMLIVFERLSWWIREKGNYKQGEVIKWSKFKIYFQKMQVRNINVWVKK